MTNRYELILFDLDNTLVQIPNSYSFFDAIILDVLKEMKIPYIPSKTDRDQLWRTGKDYVKILNAWGVENPQDFWHHFDLIDFERRKELIRKGNINPFPDSEPILQKIKNNNIIIAIITNTILEIAKYTLNHFKLIDYFDDIVALGDTQDKCKPEPDGIIMLMEKYDLKKEKVAIIGDSIVDVEAGIRAGIDTFKIERNKGLEPPKTIDTEIRFIKISSFLELEQYIFETK